MVTQKIQTSWILFSVVPCRLMILVFSGAIAICLLSFACNHLLTNFAASLSYAMHNLSSAYLSNGFSGWFFSIIAGCILYKTEQANPFAPPALADSYYYGISPRHHLISILICRVPSFADYQAMVTSLVPYKACVTFSCQVCPMLCDQ